jgi:hypothetical protein
MGDQTLALAEALTDGSPKAPSAIRIFMDVSGQWLIWLPLSVGLALYLALLVLFAALSWRRGRLARGLAVSAGTLVASTALAWIALEAIGLMRGGMFWRAHPLWTHLATYASVALVSVALLATIGRADRTQLRAGFWLVFLIVGGAIGIAAPGGIIFFLFPPLIVLVGMIAARFWQPAERVASWIAIAFLFLTWGAMLALLEELLNGGPMWIFAALGTLLILPALIEARPLIERTGTLLSLIVAGAGALILWTVAGLAPAYSADRQQRFVIEHIADLQKRKAYWSILNDGKALPFDFWRGLEWQRGKLPYSEKQRWLADAAPVPGLQPPTVEVIANTANKVARTVTIRIHSNGADSIGLLAPKDADIRYAGVEGFVRPLDLSTKNQKYLLHCFGRSCDGATLRFVTGTQQPIEFTVIGTRFGLPSAAAPLVAARPRNARPQYAPDETITLSQVWL